MDDFLSLVGCCFVCVVIVTFILDFDFTDRSSKEDIDLAYSNHYTCYLDLVEIDVDCIDLSDSNSYHVSFDHDRHIVRVTSADRHDVFSHRILSSSAID